MQRDEGSTYSIRRKADRVSRGRRRKMDSVPPPLQVAALSVRIRFFISRVQGAGAAEEGRGGKGDGVRELGPLMTTRGIAPLEVSFSLEVGKENLDVVAGPERGILADRGLKTQLSLSCELGFGLIGSDSVEFPGRANLSTEASISTRHSREVLEKTGKVAMLCVARTQSVPLD